MNRHIKQGKLKEDLSESKRTPDPILANRDIREQKLLEAHIINSSGKQLKVHARCITLQEVTKIHISGATTVLVQ